VPIENRRPIKARSIGLIQRFAKWLASTSVTPNQISVGSVVFSLLVPIAFWFLASGTWAASILALLGIQLRLMCNLLDGMVAIEGAKKSPLGNVYNEFPDRIADTAILMGVALIAPSDPTLLVLAITASFLAVMTAYTRVLGAAVGTKHYFSGPMAKQHRMAILSGTVIALPLLGGYIEPSNVMKITLSIICIGCVATVIRRLRQVSRELLTKAG
jgi:phosphatidylglycerophosphate synthase